MSHGHDPRSSYSRPQLSEGPRGNHSASQNKVSKALKVSKRFLSVPGGESDEKLPGSFSSDVGPRASEGKDVFSRAGRPHDATLAQDKCLQGQKPAKTRALIDLKLSLIEESIGIEASRSPV